MLQVDILGCIYMRATKASRRRGSTHPRDPLGFRARCFARAGRGGLF